MRFSTDSKDSILRSCDALLAEVGLPKLIFFAPPNFLAPVKGFVEILYRLVLAVLAWELDADDDADETFSVVVLLAAMDEDD